MSAAPEAVAQEQVEPAPWARLASVTPEATALSAPGASLPVGLWAEGPRPREAFITAMNIVSERPTIGPVQLARELGVHHKTAARWKEWARAIIEHPANAALFEV